MYVPHLVVSNIAQCWFKMGGTAEQAGNFVPVDERLVSFFVTQKQESTNGAQKQECRGRSPLPGCEEKPKIIFSKTGVQRTKSFAGVWGVPTNFFFRSPQAARKALFS
jgi:hypothetical protein